MESMGGAGGARPHKLDWGLKQSVLPNLLRAEPLLRHHRCRDIPNVLIRVQRALEPDTLAPECRERRKLLQTWSPGDGCADPISVPALVLLGAAVGGNTVLCGFKSLLNTVFSLSNFVLRRNLWEDPWGFRKLSAELILCSNDFEIPGN